MQKLRLHLISLPHTETTKAYSTCAYTEKVRKLSSTMTKHGHDVFLYAGEENEAECTEHIECISEARQGMFGFEGPQDYLKIDFNSDEPWDFFNRNAIYEMRKRIKPRDFICVITGTPAQAIKDAFPDNITVEFGVGYSGIMNPGFRVFESYAWRNYCYGKWDLDGAFFDEVIPNYFDVDDFPEGKPKNYYLFIGRLNANKGLNIAQQVCDRLKVPLKVAGPGEFTGYGEYVGVVNPKQRGQLIGEAIATFVPTMYVPPFEGVHVESQLCGTPVITTDFGVFSETVDNGFNGYRCSMFHDFLDATEKVKTLDRKAIRRHAISKYSTEVAAVQYERYFKRLLTLYGEGFYAL
jgi:glycosyltransferase involved in cell wall biosynthesis